ncbi:nuclease-related domain-containing protein [Ornithinibacillus californiensis]|uniref:nuclease-related domain-containing protein n=1 Tax=Ornithinibacillus californiensis TaxID=161536 RepID=UPI00064DC2B9|nr:nuclease-related domain-containing protein [Ornithinibacillus californiensis]
MKVVKKRTPSKELQILDILSYRSNLSEKDTQQLLKLKKGYEGELLFDQLLDQQLQSECLVIRDLLLTVNNSTFQIDTLIIFPTIIELIDVKYFEGEYIYQKDNFYKDTDYKIKNPEHQLIRAETLLHQLLQRHGMKTLINSSVVFINPEFTLYNSPRDKPFILPTQINSFIKRLNSNYSKVTKQNQAIANKLISLHQEDSPYQTIPEYHYDQVQKGVVCHQCHSFSVVLQGHYCHCNDCGGKMLLSEAIIHTLRDFTILFPDKKITTGNVYDWCVIISSKQRIKRILMKHFKFVYNRRWSYYEWKAPGR